jgi:septal ring factor EnvC (AmiA/AmiB activator)
MLAERPLFWRYRNMTVARLGVWKYVKSQDEEYLFNLEEDISETKNLITEKKEKSSQLKDLLRDWENEMQQYKQQTN